MTSRTHKEREFIRKQKHFFEWKARKKETKKKYCEYMKEHYQGTERCRVNKTDTEGDKKKGDRMEGGQIRGSFTNQH